MKLNTEISVGWSYGGGSGGEGVAIVAYGKIKIPIAEKLWRTLGPLAENRMWETVCGPKQDQRSLRLWATAGFRQPAGTEFRFWIGSGPICCAVWVNTRNPAVAGMADSRRQINLLAFWAAL